VANYLETDRLTLSRFTPADVELLVALDSDPEVMRFLTGQPTPRDEIENVVLPEILKVYAEHPQLGTFKAEAAEGFIGWFGLQPTADAKVVDVGYRLNRAAWGKGYATEGTKALIAHACEQRNRQARKPLLANGKRYARTVRHPETFRSSGRIRPYSMTSTTAMNTTV